MIYKQLILFFLRNILIFEYTTIYPFVCLWTFGVFLIFDYWIKKLVQTFVYKFLCGYIFIFSNSECKV